MIKKIAHSMVFVFTFMLLSMRSFAVDNTLPILPLPSLADYTSSDGWAGAVGLKLEYLSVYNGAEKYKVDIKPDVAIQWRSNKQAIFLEWADIDGAQFGWRGLIQQKWFMQAGVRHETVLPTTDTQAANLNGFPHRGSHVIAFVESKHAMGAGWRNWVSGRFSAGPDSFGYRGQISVGHRFTPQIDGTGLDMILFSSFADKKNVNNYFGVSNSDSVASGLAQSDLKGGLRSTGVNLVFRKELTANTQITAQAGLEIYSHNIRKSSIVSDTPESNTALSVLWLF